MPVWPRKIVHQQSRVIGAANNLKLPYFVQLFFVEYSSRLPIINLKIKCVVTTLWKFPCTSYNVLVCIYFAARRLLSRHPMNGTMLARLSCAPDDRQLVRPLSPPSSRKYRRVQQSRRGCAEGGVPWCFSGDSPIGLCR